MNREWVIAGILAVLAHALLLFAFHMETAAVPLPAADTAVDVSLVAEAPAAAPAAAPAPPVPEPPSEPPPPPPEPTPAPAPPTPPVPEPAVVAEATPVPREHPLHHEPARPRHPNSAAPKMAGPAQSANNGGTAAAAGSHAGVSSGVRARSNPKPPYPAEARRLGQQGRVLLEVQVSADGRATSVSVKRSSGFPILDNAAVQAVERWTFEPARVAGLPMASRADVPVNFSLAQ